MADQNPPEAGDGQFDPETTRRIVSLAGWLQTQQLDHFSRDQLKEIATEVGIEPRYIDASIQALEESQAPAVRTTKASWLQRTASGIRNAYAGLVRRPETRPFVRAGFLGITAWVVAGLPLLPEPVKILCWIALGIAALFEAWRACGFRRGLITAATTHLSFVTLLLMSGMLRPGNE